MRSLLYCSILTLLAELITPLPVSPSAPSGVIVKQNFLSREKEYLKRQPLSEDLRNFIQRVKRRVKTPRKNANEHMYVLHNGNIIPLSNLKARGLESILSEGDVTIDDRELPTGNFTVLPLILPITFEVPNQPVTETCEVSSPKTATKSGTSRSTTNPFTEPQQTNEDSEIDPLLGSTTANVKLLSKVIKDVEDLIKLQNDAKPTAETTFCNVSGDWDSYAGGTQLRIYLKEDSRSVQVRMVPREPPMEGFLAADKWNVTALVPYRHSSMIAITAVSKKGRKIATFIGECRMCEGDETISGNWMLTRRSKSCKDREEANSFISDVLRKNNIRRLQAAHLSEITVSTSENDLSDTSDDIALAF